MQTQDMYAKTPYTQTHMRLKKIEDKTTIKFKCVKTSVSSITRLCRLSNTTLSPLCKFCCIHTHTHQVNNLQQRY